MGRLDWFFELGLTVVMGRSCSGGDFGQWLLVVAVVVLWLGLELFLAVVLGFRMNFVVDLVLLLWWCW